MRYRILFFLFLFFFFYRLVFWGLDVEDLLNIILNAFFDMSISFVAATAIFRLTFSLKSSLKNKVSTIAKAIIYFSAACVILWGLHLSVYTLTGGMNEVFTKTFDSVTFQFFDVFTILFIGSSISFAWFKSIETRKRVSENKKLIEEKRIAELRFLKNQINPHFIFNTLNAINFSIDKENTTARNLIGDFADLFRFQLYESELDFIELEKELEFIKKYIRIHEVRLSETFDIELKIEGDYKNKMIPPLLLIPFIENSFKHACNVSDEKSLILLVIKIMDDTLTLKAVNSKGTEDIKNSGGVGLDNVRRRLAILFPKQHKLKIKNEGNQFKLRLEIPLMI